MSLYSPAVRHDAIPPRDYPPAWSVVKTGQGFVTLNVAAAAWHGFLAETRLMDLQPIASAVAILPILFLSGYFYVSSIVLGRTPALSSRYSPASVSAECMKLVVSSGPIAALGPMWLHPSSPASQVQVLPPIFVAHWWSFAAYYVLPYFVGLHFIFLDTNPLFQSFGCKFPIPNRWPTFTIPELVILVVLLVAVAAIFPYYATLVAAFPSRWPVLGLFYAISILALVLCAYLWRKTHNVHFHHYLMGAVLLPLTAFPTPTCAVLQAICLGIYTEGIATWGMDPIFVKTKD
ncbi:hypothetical protein LEN26_021090 [Aphanomyces euteiches]|nr:hypothetical protein LEN26_021090 [Aphanomyces euteiches]KAH9128465.1 hypothetical protein AeMF1_001380 [Aphanomyces euteiches]KAH9191829.1 hypothetical protein AeNC1_006193 [Aphanomyces euteiches]